MSTRVEGTRLRETDKAVLVELDEGEEVWFPLSQVESMHFDGRDAGYLMVTDWIAKVKGLA